MESLGQTFQTLKNGMEKKSALMSNGKDNESPMLEEPLTDKDQCQTCHRFKVTAIPILRPRLQARGVQTNELEGDPRLICQCAHEKEAKTRLLMSTANLPRGLEARTFQNFVMRPGVHEAYGAARTFAEHGGSAVLVLSGLPGSGKSHLLEAIGRLIIQHGKSVRYEQVPELLSHVRRSFRTEGATNPIEQAENATVLLLDDLGLEKDSDWTLDVLTSLIDQRYRTGRRLAIATNLNYGDFNVRNPRLADRLFDTRSGLATSIVMEATSYRTAQ